MKKTRIIPYKAAESFRWTFVDCYDVFKPHLHRMPAKVSANFWSHLFTVEKCWKEKKNPQFKTSKVEYVIDIQSIILQFSNTLSNVFAHSLRLPVPSIPTISSLHIKR